MRRDLKTRTSVPAKGSTLGFSVLLVALLFFSGLAQLSAFAQAGRPIPQPMPSPTPATVSTALDKIPDSNNDPYKVVFPTTADTDRSLQSFVKELNKAGEQGYNLISVAYRWQPKTPTTRREYFVPVAILKLDEVQYEYDWFETTSDSVVTIDGFASEFAESSKRGFRLANRFLSRSYCDPENALGTIGKDIFGGGGACELKDLFLLKRRKGAVKPGQFIIARSAVRAGFKVKNEADLTTQIKENLQAGFYPVEVFSKWEILLAHAEEKQDDPADNPDVKVVMSLGLTSVREKVNALGKQGYRLATMNQGTAVMYRYGETVKPLAYTWLKAGDKKFDERLATLQAAGAMYRMSYPEPHNIKNRLVFEQGPVGDGERREYKVIQLEFQVVQDWKVKSPAPDVLIELADSYKAVSRLLTILATQGFIVRDLFVSNVVTSKVSVLLERSSDRITTP
jgi:hypothetical protein